MKNYKYVAINLQKKKFTGVFLAEDEKDLSLQLSRQGLFLVSCKPYSGRTPSSFFTTGTGKVNTTELTTFCRQFAIMINAGISVIECLQSLKEQTFSSFFKNLLQVIYEDVKSGIMLSQSLNKHEKVFPEFFRSMVYVGEASGRLDTVFNSLADYYERESDLRKKVWSAISYPLALLGMTVGIVALMLIYIIPIFKNTLVNLDVTPTGFTKTIYDFSDFLTANWLYILAAISVIALVIFIMLKTKKGKEIFDGLLVGLPVVSKITIAIFCSRFARSFSLLLSSGLDMAESLDAAAVVVTNSNIKKRYLAAADEIKHGVQLSVAFDKHKLFPKLMTQMISVGEKTAELEQVLTRSCKFFDDQAETSITSATSKIQPIMLMIMGGIIGVLFIAVYSPIISIMQGIA